MTQNGNPVRVFLKSGLSTEYVHSLAPEIFTTKYLVLCAGLHVIPSTPAIPGVEHVLKNVDRESGQTPAIFHSAEYKSRSQLSGRRVLILGTGETGMDLAYEAVKAHAKEVVLCSRSG